LVSLATFIRCPKEIGNTLATGAQAI